MDPPPLQVVLHVHLSRLHSLDTERQDMHVTCMHMYMHAHVTCMFMLHACNLNTFVTGTNYPIADVFHRAKFSWNHSIMEIFRGLNFHG